MEFVTAEREILCHPKKYATNVLRRFYILKCNSAATSSETRIKLNRDMYRQSIRSLKYLKIQYKASYCL